MLYILDEPSIGLHPRDNERLLRSLESLRDLGNTVLVVEHDEDTMRAANYIVDFGPGPGVRGGQVVAAGSYAEVLANPASLTGQYLSGARRIEVPAKRRKPGDRKLTVVGARHHNLKNVTVDFPLGTFICVTGVSGSGKSSLVNDILREGLRAALQGGAASGDDDEDAGEENGTLHEVGASRPYRRGQPDRQGDRHRPDADRPHAAVEPRHLHQGVRRGPWPVRTMTESKVRGYPPGRFSFNKPGGRCEACEGNGSNRLNMDFLADVWVTCPVCEGRRFNRETLQVKHKGRTIHDVLEMDVQDALDHFQNIPKIRTMLQTLHDVGLDYIKLGQPARRCRAARRSA
ncbi:MAG: hypothetical protein U0736_10470 [Gemmataceae bacterium]